MKQAMGLGSREELFGGVKAPRTVRRGHEPQGEDLILVDAERRR